MKKLFYFYGDWCQHCQTLNPIMDSVSRTIPVEKINTDYEADRAHHAKVTSVPTVVLAQDGQEIKRFVGPKTYQQVMDFYNG